MSDADCTPGREPRSVAASLNEIQAGNGGSMGRGFVGF